MQTVTPGSFLNHSGLGGTSTTSHESSNISKLMDSHSTPPTNNGTSQINTAHGHSLEMKIGRAKKRIQEEQQRRDQNVEEYLKMAAVAERNQLPQVKAMFEKRNTKAATHIAALQRKLNRYEKDLNNLNKTSPSKLAAGIASSAAGILMTGGRGGDGDGPGGESAGESPSHGAGIGTGGSEGSGSSKAGRLLQVKDALGSGVAIGTVSQPRDSYLLLKKKFGSADNIPSQVRASNERQHGSANIPYNSAGKIAAAGTGTGTDEMGGRVGSEHCSAASGQGSSGIHAAGIDLTPAAALLYQQINDIHLELSSLREEYENFKTQASSDSSFLCQGLQEERFRAERLEEQVNDLTELHQAETGNLKQALADAEEKLSYQGEERLRDLAEMLDSCLTKISRLEQQQQQLVTIEGIENSTARALAVKMVNIGLTVLQLLLLIVATAASTLAPFMGSRLRFFASLVLGLAIFLAHRKWPQVLGSVLEYWTEFLNSL